MPGKRPDSPSQLNKKRNERIGVEHGTSRVGEDRTTTTTSGEDRTETSSEWGEDSDSDATTAVNGEGETTAKNTNASTSSRRNASSNKRRPSKSVIFGTPKSSSLKKKSGPGEKSRKEQKRAIINENFSSTYSIHGRRQSLGMDGSKNGGRCNGSNTFAALTPQQTYWKSGGKNNRDRFAVKVSEAAERDGAQRRGRPGNKRQFSMYLVNCDEYLLAKNTMISPLKTWHWAPLLSI